MWSSIMDIIKQNKIRVNELAAGSPELTNQVLALDWNELAELAYKEDNRIEGPTNAQSILRLFGEKEKNG